MTHRVYLRRPDQTTTDKTTTEDEAVARFAFERLCRRQDLSGQRIGVAWSANGQRRDFYDFNAAGSTAVSEPTPPPYVAATPSARNRAALEVLESRYRDLDRQLDQLMLGESVDVGITADSVALQLVQVRAAHELLQAKLSKLENQS